MTVKAVEACLDMEPRFVSLWLTRGNQPRGDLPADSGYKRAGRDLPHLRCQWAHRRPTAATDGRGTLPERPSIEERPEIVEKRQ